ncbi:MAG: DJ-1/PfpI family protein [Bacteroidales bacterium]
MMKNSILLITISAILLLGCNGQSNSQKQSNDITGNPPTGSDYNLTQDEIRSLSQNLKPIIPGLPTIGILMFDDVLQTELTAPVDVFAKHSEDGKQLFNVITIAEKYDLFTSEEGLKMFPDYIFSNAPQLDIIIVPSAYDMTEKVKDITLVDFIKNQDNNTEYTISNCAGATLIGEAGIASGKKIVTWIGGGVDLQKAYPDLKVQDDSKISFVEDGKFMSSNGNLASYISSLELLEKLTDRKHREYVESSLYLDRLQQWKK